MAIRLGIVVAAHPEDHSVDVVMTDDYQRLAGVQVMSHDGGDAVGTASLYVPTPRTGDDKWALAQRAAENVKAVIDFSGVMPIVLGFLYPQIGQMTFAEKNRRIARHASDVYSTTTAAGDFELSFPNGTFLRVGATPDHEDLTGKDVDGNWAITKNKGAATHLRLVLGNAGVVKADLHIDPTGNVTGSFQGTGNLTFAGAVTINAPVVTLNTPLVHCTQALQVDGALNVAGQTTLAAVTSNGHDVGSTHKHINSGGSGVGGTPQ